MTASDVAMKRALPRPQPARKPTISPMPPAAPARAAKTTMITRPVTSVALAPIRLETHPVTSIITAVMSR